MEKESENIQAKIRENLKKIGIKREETEAKKEGKKGKDGRDTDLGSS